MPPLKIPERFRYGILEIGRLKKKVYEELNMALDSAPRLQDKRELSTWLQDETGSLDSASREKVLSALVSMYRVRRNSRVSSERFAEDVWDSLVNDAPDFTAAVEADDFKGRLVDLLNHDSLDLPSARLSDVRGEVERSFCKVRVLTDLRPRFQRRSGRVAHRHGGASQLSNRLSRWHGKTPRVLFDP